MVIEDKISIQDIILLQQLSEQNLSKTSLKLTFFDMLQILKKHNLQPYIKIGKIKETIIGYCLYSFPNENDVQISHLVLAKEWQGKGKAAEFFQDLMVNFPNKNLTADISYDNEHSKRFFEKHHFTFSKEDQKSRWNVKL